MPKANNRQVLIGVLICLVFPMVMVGSWSDRSERKNKEKDNPQLLKATLTEWHRASQAERLLAAKRALAITAAGGHAWLIHSGAAKRAEDLANCVTISTASIEELEHHKVATYMSLCASQLGYMK